MLILDTFGLAFEQPDASPCCVKSMCLLTATGVPWEPGVGIDSRKASCEKPVYYQEASTASSNSPGATEQYAQLSRRS